MRRAIIGLLFFAVAAVPGCVAGRTHQPLKLPPSARLIEVREADSNAGVVPVTATVQAIATAQAPQKKNILVLSGGGANGAFTVGVLKGWSDSRTRPPFDVVTGISTGALIAPFAFLGPDYDDELVRLYTEVRDRDVFRRRIITGLLWSDALADSTPLRRNIELAVTPELLERIAQAHAQGRRLYVGTTDLDQKRLVTWDLGAIAAGTNPDKLELFRKVLLASASVPGLMPPVPLDVEVDGKHFTELHVDGGVTTTLFLQPAMLGACSAAEAKAGGNSSVWVIVAGKLRPAPHPVGRGLFHVAEESFIGMLQSRYEADVVKTYLLARSAGAKFAVTAIPDESGERSENTLSFNPRMMREFFEMGYDAVTGGTAWTSVPAGLKPGDDTPPRSGLRFIIDDPKQPK
jgi:predicted acylesterase/phospholipase RssA